MQVGSGRWRLLGEVEKGEGVEGGFGDEGGGVDELGAFAGGGIVFGAMGVVAEGAEAVEGGTEGAEVIGVAEAAAGGGEGFEATIGGGFLPD